LQVNRLFDGIDDPPSATRRREPYHRDFVIQTTGSREFIRGSAA
jgi:hypothetical protein